MGETMNWPSTDYCPHQHTPRMWVPFYIGDTFPASNNPPRGGGFERGNSPAAPTTAKVGPNGESK